MVLRKVTHISLAGRAMWRVHWLGSPELELVFTSATQAADCDDRFLARSDEAVLRVREVLAS